MANVTDATTSTAAPTSCDASLAQALAQMDPKEVFGDAMGRWAQADDLATIVVSDYGRRLSLGRFRELRGDGYIQVGIAEQSQVGVGGSMALEGLHVVAPAYACFLASRAIDQVRVSMGSMAAPLVLVGLAAGFGSGILGASHMALDDVAVMRAIPGIDVVCPADNAELWCVLQDLARDPRPAYVRMSVVPAGTLVSPACEGLPRGRSRMLSADSRPDAPATVSLVATGGMVAEAARAADALRARGVTCDVVAMPWVVPLDTIALDALSGSRLVVTVEEHIREGGLGGAVAEHLSEQPGGPALLRLGAPSHDLEADDQSRLLERSGLTADAIAASVAERLHALSR